MSRRKKERSGLRKRCRCGAKRWNDCLHPWHFRLKLFGQQKRHRVNLQEHFNVPGVITRDDADALADRYRVEVRAGVAADVRLTLRDIVTRYEQAHPGKHYYLKILLNSDATAANGTTVKLGTKPLVDITGDDIEHAADVRQTLGARRGVNGGRDARRHLLTSARHLFNWCIKKKILRSTPFKVEGQSVIDVSPSRKRDRRLNGDEEARLLAAADPFTHDRITAALELGGRGGELLSLTWADVHEDVIVLTTRKTRDGQPKRRELPISAALRVLLDRRRVGPDGQNLADSTYVFGNEVGERVTSRLAHGLWDATRLAAGIPKDADGRFTLRFHDLRREFGSQLVEAGAGLHEVRDTLGHSNITMTSTYLSSSTAGLKGSFKKLEVARRRRSLRVVAR